MYSTTASWKIHFKADHGCEKKKEKKKKIIKGGKRWEKISTFFFSFRLVSFWLF